MGKIKKNNLSLLLKIAEGLFPKNSKAGDAESRLANAGGAGSAKTGGAPEFAGFYWRAAYEDLQTLQCFFAGNGVF